MAKRIASEDPSRSDYRIIAYLLKTFFGDKNIVNLPAEFERVGRVFNRAGGSWERLIKGSFKDLALLRKVLKVAVAEGFISTVPRFR